MVAPPLYIRLLITVLLISTLSFIFYGLTSHKRTSVDISDIADDYITVEGYVVSKRMGAVWLANEPVSIWRSVTGYVTSDYGKGSIIVGIHRDAEDQNLFHTLKRNQKVRVYGDHLKESFPGKISAYYIEIISND